MPEYLSPGVYVEEIDAGPQPIAAVATSTAGVVGVARRGPATPTLVTSYGDFVRTFGGPIAIPDETTQSAWATRGRYWNAAESVKAFFDEGGARLYFQRVQPSGSQTAGRNFNGGLFSLLASDVSPVSRTMTLSHVVTVAANSSLDVISAEDGSTLGTVTVASLDYANRIVTLTGDAGVSARSGREVVRIMAVDTGRNVLRIDAASVGSWGNDVIVRLLPSSGARLLLGAAAGARVETGTTADASAGDTSLTVSAVAGSLDNTTPPGFAIRVNGRQRVAVTGIAAAGADVSLTLAAPLENGVPSGSSVQVLRNSVAGGNVTVSGASRLYPGAIVQLEGLGGAEVLRVVSVAGSDVTLSSNPTGTYREGDGLTVVEADLSVRYRPVGGDEVIERFAGMRLTRDGHPESLLRRVNATSRLVRVSAGPDYDGTDLQSFPAVTTAPWAALSGGDDQLGGLSLADFIGENLGPSARSGIQALEDIDEVAIALVPGIWHEDVRNALIIHCTTMAERFAIIDPPPGLTVQEVQAFRNPIDTRFAAMYYPWVRARDPRPSGDEVLLAPSGFLAGIYARVDISRGVFKAPANEVLRSIRGFEVAITKREQDILNPVNINVLRFFPGRGNRVWGARVLTSEPAWRYVPVRRLFLMVEESIDEATQWVVFEPNDEPLWARVRQSVSRFLLTQWRLGALQGATADEAFFVACDRSTMSQAEIDAGQLICEIGIAPVKPAEFVIFRIQQKTLDVVPA
jgi:Bacteriophage tail sheath protein